MRPQWHPYLFIIFFATLLEYNFHKFIALFANRNAPGADKHTWVGKNLKVFYILLLLSAAGFICAAFLAQKEVLILLVPIAAITLFYSLPILGSRQLIFRLREIPYLKIFLIACVWSCATILLPVIKSDTTFDTGHVIAMLAERFFFVLAIAIPFDVRDIEADKQAGLKTLPLLFNENRVFMISYVSLFIFMLISFSHYSVLQAWFIILPLCISAVTTFVFLSSKKIRSINYYHYGVLDGTLLLQGLLVLLCWYLTAFLS